MRVPGLRSRYDTDKRRQKSAGAVSALNFNVNNRQFNVDRNNADNQNYNSGVRGGMRVYLCCIMRHVALALRCFQPTAEHSAYFSQYSLGLENLGFICDFKLQHQTQFQHRNFKHAACFDKIRGLECFRCVLRHNQMRQTFKYAVFKAETKRISPASFCMVDNIHNCLVCFVCLIDYG